MLVLLQAGGGTRMMLRLEFLVVREAGAPHHAWEGCRKPWASRTREVHGCSRSLANTWMQLPQAPSADGPHQRFEVTFAC